MKAYKMVGNTKSGMREEIKREYKRHSKCCFDNGIEGYPGGYEAIIAKAEEEERQASLQPDNPVAELDKRRSQRNPAKRCGV